MSEHLQLTTMNEWKYLVMTSNLMLLSGPVLQQATQVTCFGILKILVCASLNTFLY